MDKMYASNSAMMGSLATGQAIQATCFTRLHESLTQLRNIRNRVSALADTLAGSVPEAADAGGETKGQCSGRFDQIDQAAGDINELCDQITGSLSRIERRL
jgi:hypothetical protein